MRPLFYDPIKLINWYKLNLLLQADNVPEQGRTTTFGILSGVTSATYVCGTLAARLLSTASTFQVFSFAFSCLTNNSFCYIFLIWVRCYRLLQQHPCLQQFTWEFSSRKACLMKKVCCSLSWKVCLYSKLVLDFFLFHFDADICLQFSMVNLGNPS